MRFSIATAFLAVPFLAVATPILEERDSGAVIGALSEVQKSVQDQNTTLNSIDKNNQLRGSDTIRLITGNSNIVKALNDTVNALKPVPPATAGEIKAYFNSWENIICPEFVTLINNYIAHKPAITKGGTRDLVNDFLHQNQNGTKKVNLFLAVDYDSSALQRFTKECSDIFNAGFAQFG